MANRWCGPYALAFVNAISTDAAAAIFRGITKQDSIKGVHRGDMARALKATCGFRNVTEYGRPPPRQFPQGYCSPRDGIFGLPSGPDPRPTLAAWLRARKNRSATYILIVPGHYIVVRGNFIYDNNHPQGMLSSEWKGRRSRVETAWEIGR